MTPQVVVYRHQLFRASETFITEQAKHLVRTEPVLLGREILGPPEASLQTISLKEHARNGPALRYWHALSADPMPFLRLLERQSVRPALVHAHFGPEGVYALRLARSLGVPLLTTFHGFDVSLTARALLTSGKPSWIRFAAERARLAQESAGFVAVSGFVRDRLIDRGYPAHRIHVRPIGIDLEKVDACRVATIEAPGRTRILAVARQVEKKGIDDLLKAVGALPARLRESSELILIGDGPLRSEYEQLASRLGLSANTRFMGAMPHASVLQQMHMADIFCVPSRRAGNGDAEGLGMVFLEAAAAGLPVVSTLHGGISEAVRDGTTGFLVRERRPDMLADKLAYLIDNRGARKKLGLAGRSWIELKYDIRSCTARLEDLYLELIAETPPGGTAVAHAQ